MSMSDSAPSQPQPASAAPPGGPDHTVRRSPRWMKVLLVVSLAVNLAVAGFAISRIVAGPRFMAAGPGSSLMDARKLLWALPSEERESLRDEFMARHHDEFMDHRGHWHDARDALAATLADEDASDDQIRTAYRVLGEIEAEVAVRWREVLADMTVRVSPQERAVFAGRMNHHGGRGRFWHGRDGEGKGD